MVRRLVCLLLGLALPSSGRALDPWPQWRGVGRNGSSAEKGLLDRWDRPPPLHWKAEDLGAGFSGAVVANGIVCTMGECSGKTIVTALSEKDGKRLWATTIDEQEPQQGGYSGPRATPTIDGDRVYSVSANGVLTCLTSASGLMVWKKSYKRHFQGVNSTYGYAESPLMDGAKLICSPGGPGADVVALDKKTGAELWRCALALHKERKNRIQISYSSPVVSWGGGVKQYIKYYGGGLGGIHAETGKQLWVYGRVDTEDDTISTPIVHGDYVFASASWGGGAALVKLSAAGGGGVKVKEVYYYPPNKLELRIGGAVLVDGYLYLGHGSDHSFPKCVEFLTGKMMWGRVRGSGVGSATVAYADGHIYFLYGDGVVALVAAAPEKYQVKGKFRIPCDGEQVWAQPAISDGRLYLRADDMLYCYDLRKHGSKASR